MVTIILWLAMVIGRRFIYIQFGSWEFHGAGNVSKKSEALEKGRNRWLNGP